MHNSDTTTTHATVFGLLSGAISTAIPDSFVSYGEKLLVAIPIAFVSGVAYTAGAYVWARLRARWLLKAGDS